MNCQRILLATDFSECSDIALKLASRLASEKGAILYITHVDELIDVSPVAVPRSEEGYFYDAPWGYGHHEKRKRLESLRPTVTNVACEHRYLSGLPVVEILKLAEHEHVDLIVLGSHGRSGLSRLVMGSVAEGVMRGANCPVIIVKQPVGAGQQDTKCGD
jgi:nucleotide-binding universal stress UspA family protein